MNDDAEKTIDTPDVSCAADARVRLGLLYGKCWLSIPGDARESATAEYRRLDDYLKTVHEKEREQWLREAEEAKQQVERLALDLATAAPTEPRDYRPYHPLTTTQQKLLAENPNGFHLGFLAVPAPRAADGSLRFFGKNCAVAPHVNAALRFTDREKASEYAARCNAPHASYLTVYPLNECHPSVKPFAWVIRAHGEYVAAANGRPLANPVTDFYCAKSVYEVNLFSTKEYAEKCAAPLGGTVYAVL